MAKHEKYLPLGSIVLLKGAKKRLMIYGRKQKEADTDEIWDYIGCLYPEGNIRVDQNFLFNHEQIEKVYCVGYIDEEEYIFTNKYLTD